MNNACVDALFEKQVGKTPNAVALRYKGAAISYAELNLRVNQLSHHLSRCGVGLGDFVGVCLPLSPEAVVAVISVLKAGGAYVPLDPEWPASRLEQVISTLRVTHCVTNSGVRYQGVADRFRQIVAMDLQAKEIAAEPVCDSKVNNYPASAAYVIYTSGSTGKPKGVVGTHASISNGLSQVPFNVGNSDEVCALNTTLTSGFSVSRLFLPLLVGVQLEIIPEGKCQDPDQLTRAWQQAEVSSAAVVTPLLRQILTGSYSSRLSKLRTLTVGGSRITSEVVDSFAREMPHATLLNGYGFSEIGGAAIVSIPVDRGIGGLRGGPFPNVDVYVLDSDLNPISAGAEGEVYIGAEHLSHGYLGLPGLTAERFLPHPYRYGERLYRTGDIGRLEESGEVEIIGRVDDQVQIRGFRVELGEIELELLAHEQVQEAVVTAQDFGGDRRLLAYVVPTENSSKTARDLREYLEQRLPGYQVPSIFVMMPRLPRTGAGKVDRMALPPPTSDRPDLGIGYERPRNQVEEALTEIWREALCLDLVSINDYFIDLGGTSLLAMDVIAQVRDRLSVALPLSSVMSLTVAELAEEVVAGQAAM